MLDFKLQNIWSLPKKLQIFSLKFQMISSVIETSLRQYILEFTKNQWILFLALVFPITLYYQFLENSKYKKFFSLLEQNLPGTLLRSNSVSWETFQKTNYLPIFHSHSQNVSQFENHQTKQKFNQFSLFDTNFHQKVIQKIDYWGDCITFDFSKKWTSYQKNNLSGFVFQKNTNRKPLVYVARDNVNSPFYFCYVLNTKKSFSQESSGKEFPRLFGFGKLGKTKFQKNPEFQKKYYQLDEFPRKINHLFSLTRTNQTTLFHSVNNQTQTEQFKPLNGSILEIGFNHILEIISESKFDVNRSNIPFKLIGIQIVQNELKNNGLKNKPNSNSNTKENLNLNLKMLAIHLDFQNQLNKVNFQLQNLFYNNGYTIPQNVFSSQNQPNSIFMDKYHEISAQQILRILNSSPSSSENGLISSIFTRRLMSGFHYPDFKVNDLISLTRQKNYSLLFPGLIIKNTEQISNQLKIDFGSHFSYPTEYNNIEPDPVRLNLKYYSAKFEGNDSKINYSGPVIQFKNNNSLFYQAINWFKVRHNLQAIFNPLDPRKNQYPNFFGNTSSFSFSLKEKEKENENELRNDSFEKTQINQFQKQLFKRQELTAEKETVDPSLSYFNEFVVPYLNSQEWHFWLLNQTNSSLLPYIQSFPIRQLSFLKNTQSNQSFDLLDYQNPTIFLKRLSGNIQYEKDNSLNSFTYKQKQKYLVIHEDSVIQASMPSSIVRQNYATVTYLKRTNQYQSEKNKVQTNLYAQAQQKLNSLTKRENWEPLHWGSWLVMSQFVFAIFVIQLLRQFALSYGRELVSYLIDLFSSLGIFDSSFKEDLISEDSKYRIVNQPTTRFKNIAGIEQIFSQLSEIVWFLRNSKRFLDTGNHLPKGILLVGPPGTGKTLLVQALAGEAQIPIFLQPAGAFNTTESLGAQRLQKLFEKAKQLAPCIIFFDEIDSIGKRRSHIIQNPAGTDNLFQIVSNTAWQPLSSSSSYKDKEQSKNLVNSIPFQTTYITDPLSQKETLKMNSAIESDIQDQQNTDQLSLLMQLLIELDGLQSTKKIVIIGATNRVEVLDPALIRPGRFDKVLKLGLPKKYKRIQICQLYAQILGVETQIYWEYIGNKTFGLSGADLATIMNQSSIDAILNGTKHTMQTIELAIHKIIGDSTKSTVIEQHCLKQFNPNVIYNSTSMFDGFLPRLSYYQAGITAVQLVLPQFATPIACSLFPKHENVRYQKVSSDFRTGQLQISRRHEFKAQFIALFSGKISEFLYFKRGLITPNQHPLHSDFAQSDFTKASHLMYQIIGHWYLYWQKYSTEKMFQFSTNQNKSELLDNKTHHFLARLSQSQEILIPSIELTQYYHFQSWSGKSWWQIQVTNEETYTNVAYANWYRIFLKNPDEVIDNDEWVMPDQFFDNNEIYFLTKTNYFNDIQFNQRDIAFQTILTEILNETFEFFHENSEFIDFLSTFLIQNKYLRRFEIDHLYKQFFNQY